MQISSSLEIKIAVESNSKNIMESSVSPIARLAELKAFEKMLNQSQQEKELAELFDIAAADRSSIKDCEAYVLAAAEVTTSEERKEEIKAACRWAYANSRYAAFAAVHYMALVIPYQLARIYRRVDKEIPEPMQKEIAEFKDFYKNIV
jgi:uncharacterized radical SAM superfamily Fe-S cluster-containing enzyme